MINVSDQWAEVKACDTRADGQTRGGYCLFLIVPENAPLTGASILVLLDTLYLNNSEK